MLRTLVADDEKLARQKVIRLLRREPDINIVGECGDGQEALTLVKRLAPELLFLDVQMPELDGLAVLKALGDARFPVVIVVTAYDHLAPTAFELKVTDYLTKPFTHERFAGALERARLQIALRLTAANL